MLFDFEERPSDSPWVERIWRTRSERAGSFTSIAASRWEMVVTCYLGETTLTVRGPETVATPVVSQWVGAEFFGIVFKLGVFMPPLPLIEVINRQDITLPPATGSSFWLGGAAYRYPSYENADTFVERLARAGPLAREPLVEAALRGQTNDVSRRTAQRRFLVATGLTQSAVRQIERARHATVLLRGGVSSLDTVVEAGYFDQAHLIRSLKHYIGQTPTRIVDPASEMSLLYETPPLVSHGEITAGSDR